MPSYSRMSWRLPILHNLIIFGGAFDPIHTGHLTLAKAVQEKFHFQKFIFLPSKQPVLDKNSSIASAKERMHMIQLAIADALPSYHFEIDPQEINRETPSYSVITLQSYRKQLGINASITWLMGYDAFLQLPKWYHWSELFDLCHILIVQRPGHQIQTLPTALRMQLEQRQTSNELDLITNPFGKIFYYDAGNYPISSSQVRAALAAKQAIPKDSVPRAVLNYLLDKKLYSY